MMIKPKSRILASAFALASVFGAAVPVQSGELNIATDPLGTGASSNPPNIMFVLDDSGSMASNYMPDFVNDSHNPSSTTAGCYDAGDDSGGTITGSPDACVFGDPPFNSPDFNSIYYNPDLRYRPGVNADNSEMLEQNAANTTSWQAVFTNPYQSAATTNIATAYGDRVWCESQSDAATSGTCRQNSGYNFPDALFPYGLTSGGSVKYVTGSPYYYRMQTRQYCTNAARTSCFSGNQVTTAMLPYPAPEFCTDTELTTCAAGAAVTPAHVHFGVRWCTNNTTMTNCQRKKIGSFIHAKHLGAVINGTVSPTAAEGNIRVNSVLAAGGTISGLTIGGASVISGAITIPAGSTISGVAGLIVTAINAGPAAATYTATQSGSDVVIAADVVGTAANGRTILVTSTSTGTTGARGVITVSTAGNANTITSVTVNGQQLLNCVPSAPYTSPALFSVSGQIAQWRSGGGTSGASSRIEAPGGSSSNNRRQATRNALVAAINKCAVVPPGGSGPWVASNSGNYAVNLTAPVNLGSGANGWNIVETGNVSTTLCSMGNSGCGGVTGVSSLHVSTTPSSMAGGATAFTGSVRVGTGQFQRTEIVPANNTYTKGTLRTDCTGATCNYDEEMTNFANWYAYHRTRMHMMKGAVGRAFRDVVPDYRVGFITICPISGACFGSSTSGQNVVSAKYLKVAPFDATHKTNWYAKLYAQSPTGNTPLREALSRVGLIFAGNLGSGLTTNLSTVNDDPVTLSCQPNFAILSTDGYWNGAGGLRIDNATAMGNQDNADTAPYSLQSQGVYDGATPVASNTLADVALYYYTTDLRPTMLPTVPTTNKDTNGDQHMVTFTIGLGLDGERSYRSDYETATSGDFFDIKQGTKKWPVPAADSPTALDDLWHAAVNGRGVFFSAKNPEQVASGLSETLDQLAARVGAGAAAATSNLQPVAGDNFAFTAQYQTADWIGDLKARTIDLNSGTVSAIQLWSASEILDAGIHSSRRIFTFHPTESPAVNRMKHFCMPADIGAGWCNDGPGVTDGLTAGEPNEQQYFDPDVIALGQETQWTTSATVAQLVNYLRGDITNYNTGAAPRGASDLFRARASILGDIVNAQPAYVRRSPFGYADMGFSFFKACTEGKGSGCAAAQFPDPSNPRKGTVYAASNDGMLHAFETDVNNSPYYQTAGITTAITSDDTFAGNNTGNGVERWAYIPGMVLPTMHSLASEPYTHQYYVDGSPVVGDICVAADCTAVTVTKDDWRTILVAGLNSGGKGYYALDITNPSTSGVKALWEFGYTSTCVSVVAATGVPVGGPFYGDCHVGLSYGNPIITKRASDGKWVVLVTSGYNNGSSHGNGDGQGYLYVLDAASGRILHRLTTSSGTAASPSGLARINGWTEQGTSDNTALAIYGGDLDGNLWRFDLDYSNGTNTNYLKVTKIAQAVDGSANPQPITVKPELGLYSGKRIVLFATGKFVESADKVGPFSANEQSIYALLDDLSTGAGPIIGNVRGPGITARVFAAGGVPGTRTVAAGANPTWSGTNFGWRIDLPDVGERVNVDPQLQLGTLVVASNVPNNDTCTAGGSSWLNFLDYATGSFVPGASGNMASTQVGSSLIVGINVIMLPGGKVVAIATTAANQQLTQDTPVSQANFQARRVSWRELVVE